MSSSLSSLSSTSPSNLALSSASVFSSRASVRMSTKTASIRSPETDTASLCSASKIHDVAPYGFQSPYCAYNAHVLIPDLSSCCGDGEDDLVKGRDSTVYVHKNCNQYCTVSSSKTSSWRACVINHYPEANVLGHFYPCFFENDRLESNVYTEDDNPNDGDELASSTDDPDVEAGVEKPSVTLVGWIVSILAVGAGFMG